VPRPRPGGSWALYDGWGWSCRRLLEFRRLWTLIWRGILEWGILCRVLENKLHVNIEVQEGVWKVYELPWSQEFRVLYGCYCGDCQNTWSWQIANWDYWCLGKKPQEFHTEEKESFLYIFFLSDPRSPHIHKGLLPTPRSPFHSPMHRIGKPFMENSSVLHTHLTILHPDSPHTYIYTRRHLNKTRSLSTIPQVTLEIICTSSVRLTLKEVQFVILGSGWC